MELTYTLSFADWKAALRLNRRKRLLRRFGAFIWPTITVVCLTIAFVSNVQSQLFAQCMALGAGSLVVSISYPFMRIYVDRRGYRRIFSPTRKDRSCYVAIDDKQILSGLPEVSEEKYFWNAIVGFAQDEKMTLLYLDRDKFLLFPTSAMSPAQRAELTDLVSRHVMKR
jgi:YcxB-like protein